MKGSRFLSSEGDESINEWQQHDVYGGWIGLCYCLRAPLAEIFLACLSV